jgi:hypothetical protein
MVQTSHPPRRGDLPTPPPPPPPPPRDAGSPKTHRRRYLLIGGVALAVVMLLGALVPERETEPTPGPTSAPATSLADDSPLTSGEWVAAQPWLLSEREDLQHDCFPGLTVWYVAAGLGVPASYVEVQWPDRFDGTFEQPLAEIAVDEWTPIWIGDERIPVDISHDERSGEVWARWLVPAGTEVTRSCSDEL